jgi:hypothetical protein
MVDPRTKFLNTPDIPNLPRSAVTDGANAALQQKYRFILSIWGFDAAYISDVTRPSYSISTQPYKLLNWTFNYPIELKWNPITFNVREVFDTTLFNTTAGVFLDKLGQLAFAHPDEANMFAPKDLDKRNLINGLGPVKIKMLDADGVVYEEWDMINAMVTDMKPSDLNYSSDDLTNISVTLTYDYARLHRHVQHDLTNPASMVTDSPAQTQRKVSEQANNNL